MTMTGQQPAAAEPTASDAARRAMIDSQLRTSGVNEPWVLAAMSRVPREDFVPEQARAAAYTDRTVALGQGRFLAAPLVHGKMLTEAAPQASDNALLVGDGQGYLAALLRPLVGSLDCVGPDAASKGPGPVVGKGSYTLIIIDGAIEQLPDWVAARLADNGRLVTGLVTRGVTRLVAGRKAGGTVALVPLADLGIPVLAQFAAPKRWSF